ncbi:MAG: lamin tail domain-containing protein [Candidatus Thorarchaeota archaeon]|nr:lamin tail domain-containing protein [Candidatus Thorarchaeota archaeon]
MERRSTAILIIVILLASTAAGLFYLYGNTPPTAGPSDSPSTNNGEVWISEVYYNATSDVDDEFFEFYVSTDYTSNEIVGWYVTTFDNEGLLQLPSITGIDFYDYIAVYTGVGTSDLDASDGNATLYLGLEESILDSNGDEIGLFDDEFNVIDFMRYDGGNGDDLFDNWPIGEEGSSSDDGSVSIFGGDTGDSTNWLTSIPTPASPNIHTFITEGVEFLVEIQSGVNVAYSYTGIDDYVTGKNETVDITPGAGVPASTIAKVKEHIEFSLNFYDEKGFDRGPATAAGNKIKITVKNGTSTETVGKASPKGEITIELGTIASDIDLKYVAEHELMHLFQFKTEKEGNDTVDHAPITNKWWLEGQATYWGIESTKENYNLTDEEIQDEFDRVGDHNWNDHYRDLNRSIFIGWGGSYDDYMGSYLFMKFIKEKYGEDKLKDAFDKAKDNFNNNSKDVSPEDAIAEACGKSWDQLVAEFAAWMMTDAIKDNGVPERVGHVNVTYTNNTVSDSIKVGPYGSGVERIKVNGTQPFQIDINPSSGKWKITIIYVYEDGSRSQAFNTPYTISGTRAPWPVNPGEHGKKLVEIIVIKTLVQTGTPVQVNMTVTPVAHTTPIGPQPMLPNTTYGWTLPPLFGNYTDPGDWPWSYWWLWNFTDDRYMYTLEFNVTDYISGSIFNVSIEDSMGPVMEFYNISVDNPFITELDPTMDLGEYLIRITQGTWTSYGLGTVILHSVQREGAFIDTPLWHTYDTMEPFFIPIPFTQAGTGALYINTTLNIGEDAQFFFNSTEAINARIWDGQSWTDFNYDGGLDVYWVDLHSWTDIIAIEVLSASTDVILEYLWSVTLTG